jgi:hypothetical protein
MVNNHELKNGRAREVIDQLVSAMVEDQPAKK